MARFGFTVELNGKGILAYTARFRRKLSGTPLQYGPELELPVTAARDAQALSKAERFAEAKTRESAEREGDRAVVWELVALTPARRK